MLRVLIVDDEFQGRNFLSKVLTHLDESVKVVGEAATIQQAVEFIQKEKPHLVFLDVVMNNESGFDLFQKISPINFDVIFTTAHNEFAVQAFKVNAIDYLLKPIDLEELQLALEKVKTRNKPGSGTVHNQLNNLLEMVMKGSSIDRVAIPSSTGFELIPMSSILFCESDGNYTIFYLTDKRKLTSSYTLKHYSEILTEPVFYRVHKSYLVNLDHMVRYVKGDGGSVVMSDGREIEVSKRSKEGLLKMLKGHKHPGT